MPRDEASAAAADDAELMLRLKDTQDEEALRELVRRYQKPVFTMAYRMLGNTDEAEDLAQRTFIRLWKAAGSYKPTAKFSTWLFTILRNLVFNETRRRTRKPTTSLEGCMEQGIAPIPSTEQSPDTKLEEKELQRAVDAALAALPPDAAMALHLRREQDMSYEEISRILDKSVPAVKSLLHRARRELRYRLRRYL
ncbi:MAG TPA: sigma-70 family RNA polymerase sigma factor [Candidatus Akkermansia intestinigallinarum]|uniref:Sigma-70 family RNA polymerase sigma factor n=1 Tax=Candidatus Akkermansia intestinigallinarum TaxID=2838431 RepID=A0A9D1VAJ9_9BACT|nr:sigma-70 family RNA polymerase sigma factor [Candidatus Akkermansia intestinigallinarum]